MKSCLALDRKCGEPRDRCRLHGRKVEKAVFENSRQGQQVKRVIGMQRCTLGKMKMETWIILPGMYHVRQVISVASASKIPEIGNYLVTAVPSRVEVFVLYDLFCLLVCAPRGP